MGIVCAFEETVYNAKFKHAQEMAAGRGIKPKSAIVIVPEEEDLSKVKADVEALYQDPETKIEVIQDREDSSRASSTSRAYRFSEATKGTKTAFYEFIGEIARGVPCVTNLPPKYLSGPN